MGNILISGSTDEVMRQMRELKKEGLHIGKNIE